MKNISKIMVMVVLCMMAISVFFPSQVLAHYHPAYLRSISDFGSRNRRWMSGLQDTKKLSELSIPGTHDTMSLGWGGDIVQTQGLSLEDQLNVGIRYIDIRVRAYDNAFSIHHGLVYLHSNLDDVLTTLKKFLQENPRETVFMRLKQEYSKVKDGEFNRILNQYFDNPAYHDLFYTGYDNNPSLQQVRGKVVTLNNFLGARYGISYPANFDIQDNYHLSTNWSLYDKWVGVKDHINKANNDNGRHTFITYLSGSGGSFPYFVVSGHSSPGIGAPRLATGLTHPGWAGSYPDFPRVNWFIGIATIAFEGTNVLTSEYMDKQGEQLKHTGIVVTDFPGEALINNIIKRNQ